MSVEAPDQTGVGRPRGLARIAALKADVAIMGGLLAVLAFVWGRGRGVWYWIDEGISIGISGHPLTQIPGALRFDGSPPLYYLILHVWMNAFGSSEAATHSLSLVFALACVPAALWVGWTLFGRRTGWFAAALAALSPFLAGYGNETRMYTLLALLSLLTTGAFVHAFVLGSRRFVAAFAVLLALMIYTHNWAIFFAVAAALTAAGCLVVVEDRKRLVAHAVFAFGGAGLLYLPWVPSLLYQLGHTGTPFLLKPTLLRVRADVLYLLGGPESAVALGLGAVPALMVLTRSWRSRLTITTVAVAVLGLATLAVALVVSRRQSVWELRYLAVFVGPLLLVIAVGLARGGQAAMAAIVVAGFFMAPIAVKAEPYRKSNVREVAEAMTPSLAPGDLVVSDFGRTPVLAHYLPPGLRYAETTGAVTDPSLSDQRNGSQRLRDTDPRVSVAPLLDGVSPGGHVLMICPQIRQKLNDDAPEFLVLIPQRCDEGLDVVRGDRRFTMTATALKDSNGLNPVNAFLFTRTPGS